jgi:hypothetical protein
MPDGKEEYPGDAGIQPGNNGELELVKYMLSGTPDTKATFVEAANT